VEVSMLDRFNGNPIATGKAGLVVPYVNQFAFISDIDDTFLISHSGNLRKRLFVLLTENARSRKPFEGVVNHYNLLSLAGALEKTNNAFFYVSSSEWNLYEYIREFSKQK
jgi:phosphatidate phosphatase APP1